MRRRLETSRLAHHVRRWPRRVVVTVVAVVLVLVAARVAAPFVVRDQINDRLQSIPGYAGNVERVGIHLLRGAYSLHGVAIFREEGKVRHPFFAATGIDFSVAWRELFRGKIVSDIVVENPQLTFVKGPTEITSTTDADKRWQAVVQDIFPIDITYFEMKDGAIRYVDSTRQPNVDVFIKNLRVVGTGLRNRVDESEKGFPAEIVAEGDSLGGGKLQLVLDAEPLAAQPHFELKFKVDQVNLPALNESLRAYANVDVGSGVFQLAGEMAGKDGGFRGYIKPFFQDLDFRSIEDKEKGIGGRLWERVVAGLAWLVKNKPRDQVATRIPFQGRFGDPQVGLWRTVMNLFRHGFIQAFNPTVEGSVHAGNVRPDGSAKDGSDVGSAKTDAASTVTDKQLGEDTRAGEPTGRPSKK